MAEGVLWLSEDDVRQVLTMPMALEAVEQGLKKLAIDEAENIPRTRCRTDHTMLHVLSAAAKTLGVCGFKAYTTTRDQARFHITLYDGRSGALTAMVQADYLGQIRTGAASGVATRWMARPEAATLGLLGTGRQARTQVQAIAAVRSLKRIKVHSRSETRCRAFCDELTALVGVPLEPTASAETAVRDSDIVVTATTAREPVLRGEWLADGCHVNAIGSNFAAKAEIDVEAVRRAAVVAVDSKDQALQEAGDLLPAVEAGALHWANVRELGQLIAGWFPARESARDVTLFKSLGIGIEDVVVAARVVAQAGANGLGRLLEW